MDDIYKVINGKKYICIVIEKPKSGIKEACLLSCIVCDFVNTKECVIIDKEYNCKNKIYLWAKPKLSSILKDFKQS